MTTAQIAALALVASTAAHAFELKRDSTGEVVRWAGRADFVVDERAAELLGEPQAFAAVQAAVATVDAGAPGLSLTVRAGATRGVGYDFAKGAVNVSEIVRFTLMPMIAAACLSCAVARIALPCLVLDTNQLRP